MVMHDNEFEPKRNEMYTKDKIEPQHVCEKKIAAFSVFLC